MRITDGDVRCVGMGGGGWVLVDGFHGGKTTVEWQNNFLFQMYASWFIILLAGFVEFNRV